MRSAARAARKFAGLLRRKSAYLAAFLLLALVLRLAWRDTMAWTAPTFYALPLPAHTAAWLVLALLLWKTWRRALLCVLAAGVMSGLWWRNTQQLCRDIAASGADGPRIFLWNIGHTATVPLALHELIAELAPDAVVLAEAENLGAAGLSELMKQHPGFRAVELQDGVSCLVRGSFTPPESRQLAWRVWINLVTATFTRVPGEWRLCLSDIPPWPPLPRTAHLDAIRAAAGPAPRTIIAGDFNTPLDSAGFDPWRAEFHHGFADCAAWHAPLETWCFGAPLLAIDHIWMSRDLTPVRVRKESRFGRDHAWLFVECGQ